jgi:alanine racemase
MNLYSAGEIAGITRSSINGDPGRPVRQICTDTRRIDLPGQSLFIALRGPSHDGRRFLKEAWLGGIRTFLTDKYPDNPDDFLGSTFIISANPLRALQDLAAWHRRQFNGQLVAITGSNGKTIVKEWLAQLLQSSGQVTKSPKSYNSQVGVPLSVLNITGNEKFAIMEAGISMPGEMHYLQEILDPDIGIITNIGDAHQENFSSLVEKTGEKISLFRRCKSIIYCHDHSLIHNQLEAAAFPGRLISWSRHSEAELRITGETVTGHNCLITGVYKEKNISLVVPFTDPASIENLLHIWLLLLTLGFDPASLSALTGKLEPVRMRLEQKAGTNNCTLINDFYNSDISSLSIALDLLFQQTHQSKKTLILSDILQSGMPENQLYEAIGRMLENRNIHRLIGIGPAIGRNRERFRQQIETWPSTLDFISHLNPEYFHDEAILLKGARTFAFEQISTLLEARIHATTLEIRMNDLRYNLEQYRKIAGSDVRIMAMVKAFSYGSGSIEMAKFLANERIDYLGVAFADEGMEIRRAGIQIPVMVMNPDFTQSDLIIDNHLEPEIFNWTGLSQFTSALLNLGMNNYPVHLKLDTGMHRLGFNFRETTELGDFLAQHPEIYLKSVFSHLAASEDPAEDEFTRLQIGRFSESCSRLQKTVGYPFIRHILNSSGIERFPEAHFDMVRLGIGLYGIGAGTQMSRKPVATLKTIISQVHELDPGESVGYGRATILAKPARIGIIPVGYADGIDRRLGNGRYHMIAGGQPVPTIGNICMDMTMIDLTECPAREGDEVVVFGPGNPVTGLASALNTIPYEVLTSIAPRVKRIYLFD